MDIDELSENFELLEDWEDKYRYLIDLGEKLPPFAEECRTDEWKVSGCQSQVWLVPSFVREGNNVRLHFVGRQRRRHCARADRGGADGF